MSDTPTPKDECNACPAEGPSCGCGSGRFRWAFLALAVAVAIIAWAQLRGPGGPGIAWRSDYEVAIAEAKAQGKPVLLAFSSANCSACVHMKKTAYHDPAVVAASADVVAVMVDVYKQEAFANQYEVEFMPTYVLKDKTGQTVDRFAGTLPPAEFAAKLAAVRDGS